MENLARHASLLLLVSLLSQSSFGRVPGAWMHQRNSWIEGKVITEGGKPVPDVSIVLKSGGRSGTNTGDDGYFKLLAPEGKHTLVFSHTAYESAETTVTVPHDGTGRHYYNIYLKEKRIGLKEVALPGQPLSAVSPPETIRQQHALIAGGTSVVVMQPEVQRLETMKDALKYEPGVVIQEFFGANDQPKLSIRGSGIQSNPQRRGVYLLQDGIPVNFADGSFIIGVMDPAITESVEVFKGANALRFGAATLGGAVNFNSRTGRYAAGVQAKAEGGSYGYGSVNVLMGDSRGNTDAFLSVSGSRQDGFREHNRNRKLNMAANFGYRVSNHIDNRTYLHYSYLHFDVPGPLTINMLRSNPAQINRGIKLPYYMGPDIARDKPGREATVMRASNRTAFRLAQSTDLTVSAYYQLIEDRFVFPIVLSTQRSTGNDGGITIHAVHRTGKGTLTAGFLGSHGNIDRRGHINKDGLDSYPFSRDDLHAFNLTLYTEYHYRAGDRLHVIGNVQAVSNGRNSKDVFPDPELRPWYSHSSHKYRYFYSYNTSLNQQFRAINPRIGTIYNAGPNRDVQLFANVSASHEPPTFDELVGTRVTDNINTSPREFFAIRLDKQSSWTAEIGTRRTGSRFGWNVSLYRSWINNELLEVKDFVLGVKETKNYPETIHQGLELGFTAIPAEGLFSATGKDRLIARGMYTYSDFHFSSGAYSGNRLAGVPIHYLTGFLEYHNPGRLLLSLNMESQPAKSPIDHTNTVYQPAFTIFGFRAGIDGWKNVSFYIEGKNIFNTYYASGYVVSDQILLPPIPFPQFTADSVAFFMPGQTRAIYAGVSYKLK